MSSSAAPARVPSFAPSVRRATAPAPAQPTPDIHLVAAPARSRSRVPFVLLCMAVLVAALVSVLLLNTAMAHGAYEERDLQSTIARLAEQEQALLADLDAKSSPGALAKRARELGMVQDSTPAFIDLGAGKIIGAPAPAKK
ncbi:hypothetical protein ATL41_0587 [Flavimobilis soli]|uniref:Cell division protein FtsL n=1 Tax=Flavimobilis soli TaxID=442709 RepID=A0A2A9EA00_9MICO|nr:hypothetical protein [Flavimobilis soli]PFG35887.1 hypothetical protein ATL41_0587 [Flavimobilis soli]